MVGKEELSPTSVLLRTARVLLAKYKKGVGLLVSEKSQTIPDDRKKTPILMAWLQYSKPAII